MRILITGIAGFYGHHLAKSLQDNHTIIGIDKLDEGGSLDRLKEIDFKGKMFHHDLRSPISKLLIKKIGKIDVIFHLAAMSHVDRSIEDPIGAVLDNVVGTANILEYARRIKPKKFIYFSTDEVFGPTKRSKFEEWDRFNPHSPYSATKAGGEDLCLAYHNTYNTPIIITHCMNIFGERQHPEKFIPKIISLVLKNKVVPIYADKRRKTSGSRSYIYVDDVTNALMIILKNGKVGEKYNIEGTKDVSNLIIAKNVAKLIGRSLSYKMIASDKVRPGNDFSYGIKGDKLKRMGFSPNPLTDKLTSVVKWYLKNKRWLN